MRPTVPPWLIPDRWLAGASFLVCVLCAAVALNYTNTRRQQEDARAVTRTQGVIDAIGIARTSVRALQLSAGRLLFQGEADTREYVGAAEEMLQATRYLGDLLRNDEAQRDRVAAIGAEVERLLDLQRATLLARRDSGAGGAAASGLGADADGDDLVRDLNNQLRALELSQRALLEQRAASSEGAYRTALATGLVTGVTSVLLVALLAALLRRHLERTAADAASMRALSEELREADRRKDRFLATLAHELRNPLAPVRTAAAVLDRARNDPTKLAWGCEVIQRQVSHMAALLDDLLDVARITQGKLHLRREPVDLRAAVDVAVEAARPVLDRKHHALAVDLPPEPVTVEVDALRFSQVLTNLLTNAAKYTDPQGRIELWARTEGRALRLGVRDNGIGMDPAMLEQVFRMFAQADTGSHRAEGGLGVGLALARGVVGLHGGTVNAHSEGPGHGSEFTIELPDCVLPPAPPVPAAPPPVAVPPPAAPAALRILVADDNRDAAEAVGMVLEMEGHVVQVVDGGRAALDALASFHPDVAILDIGMPDMDGWAVARAMRKSPAGRRVALVALTGWGQAEDRARSLAAGFDAHLTKPVDPATIRALLASPIAELNHARSAIRELTHEE